MRKEPKHINLHLPTSWATCTVGDLEQIAAAILMEQQHVSRLHPYDSLAVRIRLVFAINRLEIVEYPAKVQSASSSDDDTGDVAYIVRFADPGHRTLCQRLRYRIGRMFYHSDSMGDTFALTIGHVHALSESLSWIDEQGTVPIVRFPYPELRLPARRAAGSKKMLAFQGPPPMMDGYTWREYRHLQDWMQLYVMQQNRGRKLIESHKATEEQLRQSALDIEFAQSHFLAVLFHRQDATAAHSDKSDKEAVAAFRRFDPIRWQVILFWWSSLMFQLQKKFPHVFKEQPVKRGQQRRDTPWDFYNRVTATLQKEYQLSESEQNDETYSVTLQKLENMAQESEEMKRLNQRYKSKGKS